MTPETRASILGDINAMVADSDPKEGPDYPKIFRNVAILNNVSLEEVHAVVRDDAAGTMGAG